MKRKQFLTRLVVVVVLSSVVGANWGQSFLRIVSAKDKPAAKRANQAKVALQGIKPAVASCPTIKVQPLSLFAEDYSSGEGLGVRHGDVEPGTSLILISGLPDGTSAQITLTFELTASQIAQTENDKSGSIALSAASVYLSGAGSNFLIKGSDLSSENGVTSPEGTTPLPTGTLQYNVSVFNGTSKILAWIEADAITSTGTATASTTVGLDLVDASFSGNLSAIKAFSAGNCVDPCGFKSQEVEYYAGIVEDEFRLLQLDPLNLYCTSYSPNTNKTYRYTYCGHIKSYNQLRNLLNKKIKVAMNNDPPCYVSSYALAWAATDPPTRPATLLCAEQAPCP